MFFKKTTKPANVAFYQHNLLEPFPTNFLGQYDVVNARALVVVLFHDEWEPGLRNLISLLRMMNQSTPTHLIGWFVFVSNFQRTGRYIQWLDCSVTYFVVKGGSTGQVPTNSERWIELLQTTAKALGKTPKSRLYILLHFEPASDEQS